MSYKPELLNIDNDNNQHKLPAGNFSSWLEQTRNALMYDKGITVPCGTCRACCTSSYFIHIMPQETKTIKHIPKELLFPAPGFPEGNMLLGYYKNGHCPMLVNDACSIYKHRSLTCRSYDCRIFTAAGITAGGSDKDQITKHARLWEFIYPEENCINDHLAVKVAAKFIGNHIDSLPEWLIPKTATQLAVLAIKVYNVFVIENKGLHEKIKNKKDADIVKAMVKEFNDFENRKNNSAT